MPKYSVNYKEIGFVFHNVLDETSSVPHLWSKWMHTIWKSSILVDKACFFVIYFCSLFLLFVGLDRSQNTKGILKCIQTTDKANTWQEQLTSSKMWAYMINKTNPWSRFVLWIFLDRVCSDGGLTLETSAKHHIPQATNIPYQPCWSNPYLAYSPTQKNSFFQN